MTQNLTKEEQQKRKEIAQDARGMVEGLLVINASDETSVMANYRDYYLQISFSELHPLMAICLARAVKQVNLHKLHRLINELNLRSILGSHSVNEEAGCYSYRATHWLDTRLEPERFYEILDRCIDEAERGYQKLASV